jgi:23S rRNA pseudouridine1911/1915/1917 synthase
MQSNNEYTIGVPGRMAAQIHPMTLNRGFAYREQIGVEAKGRTVLEHLVRTRRHSSASEWSARIGRGEVELDGEVAASDDLIRRGHVLVWRRPPWNEPDVPLTYDLVYEDAAILVVVKPAGLPTLAAGGFLEHTLLALVRATFPGASPVHRLGRHTSGLLLLALTRESAAALGRAWHTDAVVKRYRALVIGRPGWDEQEVTVPIGPVAHPRLGTVHAASPVGRPARSVARVLERRDTDTLVEVDITTGRPHQIRIHLAALGFPLVGDGLYAAGGMPGSVDPALPGDGGYQLHAERLRFLHPTTGVPMDFRARPPSTLEQLQDRSLQSIRARVTAG